MVYVVLLSCQRAVPGKLLIFLLVPVLKKSQSKTNYHHKIIIANRKIHENHPPGLQLPRLMLIHTTLLTTYLPFTQWDTQAWGSVCQDLRVQHAHSANCQAHKHIQSFPPHPNYTCQHYLWPRVDIIQQATLNIIFWVQRITYHSWLLSYKKNILNCWCQISHIWFSF